MLGRISRKAHPASRDRIGPKLHSSDGRANSMNVRLGSNSTPMKMPTSVNGVEEAAKPEDPQFSPDRAFDMILRWPLVDYSFETGRVRCIR